MGRTSKFTFPLPARKQKKDTSKHWDTKSNSGISICISESTASHTGETTTGRLDKDEVASRRYGPRGRWEDESSIIPGNFGALGVQGDSVTGVGTNDMMTDASSLRRRESSSTIVSFYDKSKLPLSISQQTSASAIARGLPAKASSILDIDGTLSSQKVKKKPSKLDLSHLLSKARPHKHTNPNSDSSNGPAFTQPSSDISYSLAVDSRPTRRPTSKASNVDLQLGHSPETAKARAAVSAASLANLYEHYEQRSFQNISMELDMTASGSRSSSYAISKPTRATNDQLSPSPDSNYRATSSGKGTSASPLTGPATAVSAQGTPSSLVSLPTDYAASISSRHTRTSKASRTDRSLVEFDLHQSSVLSLSSDSEDDYSEAPKTFTSRRPSADSSLSPTIGRSMSSPQAARPHTSQVDRPSTSLSGRQTRNDYHLKVESESDPVIGTSRQPISTRTSLLSDSSSTTKTTQSIGSVSRLSLASTVTAKSTVAGSNLNTGPSNSSGVHEARAVTMTSAQKPQYCSSGHLHQQAIPPRRSSQNSHSSERDRSSMSPTSSDIYLQSPLNPLLLDDVSIRSGRSMASVNSIGNISSPRLSSQMDNSISNDNNDNVGRLMTVTRQEEMLLAALRTKRARMRENIIAEIEAEHDNTEELLLQHVQPQPHLYLRGLHNPHQAPDQPLPPPPKNRLSMDRKGSSSRQGSRRSSTSNSSRLAPLHEMPYSHAPAHNQQQTTYSARSNGLGPGTSDDSSVSDFERGRILLCYDHQREAADGPELRRPNPQPGHFIDFDDENSDDLPLQQPVPKSRAASGSGPSLKNFRRPPRLSIPGAAQENTVSPAIIISTQARSDSESVSSRSTPNRPHGDDVHVRIFGDAADSSNPEDDMVGIPRPDSPISSETPLPSATSLSRKKQVRLSAVGYVPGIEVGLWADDG